MESPARAVHTDKSPCKSLARAATSPARFKSPCKSPVRTASSARAAVEAGRESLCNSAACASPILNSARRHQRRRGLDDVHRSKQMLSQRLPPWAVSPRQQHYIFVYSRASGSILKLQAQPPRDQQRTSVLSPRTLKLTPINGSPPHQEQSSPRKQLAWTRTDEDATTSRAHNFLGLLARCDAAA